MIIPFIYEVKNLFGETIDRQQAFADARSRGEAINTICQMASELGGHSVAVWFDYEDEASYWQNSPIVAIVGRYKQW